MLLEVLFYYYIHYLVKELKNKLDMRIKVIEKFSKAYNVSGHYLLESSRIVTIWEQDGAVHEILRRNQNKLDKEGNIVLKAITQLYKIGVYCAVYEGTRPIPEQLNLSPNQAIKFMKQFEKDNLKGGATSEFGYEKIVNEVDGCWVEWEETKYP